MDHALQVEHLYKVYGANAGAQDITFSVRPGEIFGLVGPNGAGKTTTVECLIGLRQHERGTVRVLGLDPQKQKTELRQRIGVQLQQAELSDHIRVWEALQLFSSFYRHTVPWEPLIEQWGLSEKRNAMFQKLSGGQRQRLFIALALVNDPEIVFLDELTTGLDPQARRNTWDLVRTIRDQGKTVVLVTHFIDEAERLCDRVGIIDQTRLIALDTPQELIRKTLPESRVRFSAPDDFQPAWMTSTPGVKRVTREGHEIVVTGEGALMAHVAAAVAQREMAPQDLRAEQATLEDVFLALTGRTIRD